MSASAIYEKLKNADGSVPVSQLIDGFSSAFVNKVTSKVNHKDVVNNFKILSLYITSDPNKKIFSKEEAETFVSICNDYAQEDSQEKDYFTRFMFKCTDKDHNGYIDREEFKKFFKVLQSKIFDHAGDLKNIVPDEFFDEVDENKDGKISYEEFNKVFGED
ncbi:hypothetical protein EIN_200800 [Entamoeba invadens IP1]|uniref:EF-hand domain-containing protein n=1 Tax=Entamoeba invadens IP1 TaxID=370355 RepID=L7FL87_ENTIV|nr:hypothetical protein EIN_200800 [Entamoeba invadens IP1]ELP83642.1 hypothetical protein EIN_200800 [Entamoeba invadens IP1]|eukprot:XP_004182988.1 hypothetical protein EIN_200800 [Entamoeba invadens IP1]